MTLVFFERGKFIEGVNNAVDADARETFGGVLVGNMGELAFFLLNDRGEKHEL